MQKKKFSITVGDQMLAAEQAGCDVNHVSDFVFLHGGGKGNKERMHQYLDESVFDSVPNVTAFDFSGHGESTGELRKGSLAKRVEEARAVISAHTTARDLTICAGSMGGYIAIKMLEHFDVTNLFLFAPGIYDRAAYDVQFDEGFTEIIRRERSWENSDIVDILKTYTGNLIIFAASEDAVIPDGVIDLIYDSAVHATHREIVTIENCTHKIADFFDVQAAERLRVAGIMEKYLGN